MRKDRIYAAGAVPIAAYVDLYGGINERLFLPFGNGVSSVALVAAFTLGAQQISFLGNALLHECSCYNR